MDQTQPQSNQRAVLGSIFVVSAAAVSFLLWLLYLHHAPAQFAGRFVFLPALNAVLNEVVRALNQDLDEKKIQVSTQGEPISIEADEQLLRQVLFNLLLNAIQAVPAAAEIQVVTDRQNASEGFL